MKYINLNSDGFADENGFVSCHVANHQGEYIGIRDEYISATTGLPAGAYLDAPPQPEKGKAIVRWGGGWILKEDNRGSIIYSKTDMSSFEVDFIGEIPDLYTIKKPSSSYDSWDGKKWVTNSSEEKAYFVLRAKEKKDELMSVATSELAPLQDAIDLDIATQDEIDIHKKWKQYRVSLNRVDLSLAPEIEWPLTP